MSPEQWRTMHAIKICRTAELGGHIDRCDHCGHEVISYNSCRNRHCPKCQNEAGQQWLEQQQDLLLPVPYFLVTFTLPTELREAARSHQKLVYHLLFRASAAALRQWHLPQQLARDPRFVGGQIGMVGVLHILR